MKSVGNIIWLVFGGLFSAICYLTGGIALCLTIIGIPFGLQCFKLAGFVLLPFGKTVVPNASSGGCFTTILNIIWIFTGGLWLAIGHLVFGLLLLITVIGYPFAKQHFKLMELSLAPFGKTVVEKY